MSGGACGWDLCVGGWVSCAQATIKTFFRKLHSGSKSAEKRTVRAKVDAKRFSQLLLCHQLHPKDMWLREFVRVLLPISGAPSVSPLLATSRLPSHLPSLVPSLHVRALHTPLALSGALARGVYVWNARCVGLDDVQ